MILFSNGLLRRVLNIPESGENFYMPPCSRKSNETVVPKEKCLKNVLPRGKNENWNEIFVYQRRSLLEIKRLRKKKRKRKKFGTFETPRRKIPKFQLNFPLSKLLPEKKSENLSQSRLIAGEGLRIFLCFEEREIFRVVYCSGIMGDSIGSYLYYRHDA